MQIRRFTFSNPQQTAKVADEINEFVWLAFAQNSDGNCNLKRVSAFDLSQIYFDIDISVDKIVKMALNSSNLFLAVQDDTLLGQRRSLTNPITSITSINLPIGVTESPVDVVVGTSVYFLTPGIASGTVAKIIRCNTSGVVQQVIELSKSGAEVNNASSITIDEVTGDLWAITNETPAKYIRIFDTGSFIWDFEIYETI